MLTIRQARTSDRESICGIHRAAVVHHYSPTHGVEAEKWAELLRAESYTEPIEDGVMIVAEEGAVALGFAEFNADSGQIEMGVLPDAEKRFIVSALLAVIETEARTRGLDVLRVNALVNTERMYKACGFEVTGATEVPLSGTVTLPCVAMEKRLKYAEPRPERRKNGNGKTSSEVDRKPTPDA